MSTLGAVLQGIDRGVMNGLNLYKTVQDEARMKRKEQYRIKRDTIADQRYEQTWENKQQQDALVAERDERDHLWEKEKFGIEQKRLEAAATATAQHRAFMQKLQAANYNLKAGKEQRAIKKEQRAEWDARVKTGMNDYEAALKDNPDAAQELYANNIYTRIGVNQRVAQAQGMEIDEQTASELYALPQTNGSYVIGRHTEGGFQPYDADPETDGEQALVMPADVFVRTFGGTEASHALQGQQQVAAAKGAVAAKAGQQYQEGYAQTLADAAGAEQQVASIEAELKTLANTPVMITSTDYRGVKTTRMNPALVEMGLAKPGSREARIKELEAGLETAQGQVGRMLSQQAQVRENAQQTLADGVATIDEAVQGKKGQERGAVATNAQRTLAAGFRPEVAVKGVTPTQAPVEAAELADKRMSRVKAMIDSAKPDLPKGEISKVNEAKLAASVASGMESVGGIAQWQASERGQAAAQHIVGELYSRGIEFGFGFLAKVAMSNPKGAQVDAGFAALENNVVKAIQDPRDREQIALLAAEKIGTGKGQTQDPEAAIAWAMDEYSGKAAPTLGDAGL